MPNTRKPAAKTKVSAKENPEPRSSASNPQPRSSASNPLQTKISSSNGLKDAETAALVASLRAEIDRLKKIQAAKPKEKKLKEIPRPTKMKSLQDAMGLTENKKAYTFCRAVVRDVIAHSGLPIHVDWRSQDPVVIGKIAQIAGSRNKQLRLYKGNWATLEIIKTLLKNRRTYKNRIGTLDDEHDTMKKEDNEDEEDDPIGGSEDNDDSWDDMYLAAIDEDDNGGIGDEDDNGGNGDEDDNGDEDKSENGAVEYEDEIEVAKNMDISGSRDGSEDEGGDEGGSEDGNGNGRKEGNGSRGVKRKNQDDEPAARAKRTKKDASGGHQAATQPAKKAMSRKKSGKKKD